MVLTLESKLFCTNVFLSNFLHMMPILRGWTLLIFKVRSKVNVIGEWRGMGDATLCITLVALSELCVNVMIEIYFISVHIFSEFEHYEVIVKETSPTGAGPAVGIATCSPLKPTPTCEILRDYFRWMPDGECKDKWICKCDWYTRVILWHHFISWGLNSCGFCGAHQQRIYISNKDVL